eukprot:CAMPEP_0194074772 /NCGR_PEP_ID=MMETSP0149-20130528/1849_1 /TAXON_ID=122233 /ORGANISM="Chaetoceros debilis, Strain MM31A-1" /LENGTH=140 /DNA_ID=CAMNT_0038755041 /DNA_START=116 /DNA_END=538 /DNA_ORIENTATION=+
MTESETHTKPSLQSALSMMPLTSSRSRSKSHNHNNPTLQQFQKPPYRTVLPSTNIHNANSNAIPADPLSPFRQIEVGVWEVEPVTTFEDGDKNDANSVQVGVEDGFGLFLEIPGTSSIAPPASSIFLMPRLRVGSGDLFS